MLNNEKMQQEILVRLSSVFSDIFGFEGTITLDTSPDDIEEWDSLGHVYLVAEIEDVFSVSLGEKMMEVETVADIVDLIMNELSKGKCVLNEGSVS